MKSKKPKILHEVAGRSMVGHVLVAVAELDPAQVVAVVGHQSDVVGPHLLERAPELLLAHQAEQLGTGHAVRVGVEAAEAAGSGAGVAGTVLVAYGDTPLLTGATLREFAHQHAASDCAVSLLSGLVDDPFGYGRVVRDAEGDVLAVVEEKDATAAQREIGEINSGIMAFDASFLRDALPRLSNDNAKGEYYLTDLVGLAHDAGLSVGAHVVDDVAQTEGANDRVQLAAVGRVMNQRIVEAWMREGVTVMDPATTWLDADVVLASDVTLLPGTQLLGATVVAEDAVVGPDTTLKDCEVGAGARVVRTHGELAVVGAGATVGPWSYLRPGTELGADGKIGAFVETKNARIGEGAKVPHLSYVGDAEVGEGTNIGAGTIVANYDGVAKHRTVVGRHARTGSNNTFVAPVRIGDGASTGGGTVVREDVPPGALAVSAGPQRTIEGWAARRRAGTPQAQAAEEASSDASTHPSTQPSTDDPGVAAPHPDGGDS
ncbi:MAG: UDP-N-acetylglucosamine diphosphorylase/glucosamine-1-phosphate N-acetyltransferase [Nocardioides sp.]|nr:UDP-N-acetylglucosamine diphosphorylase/glucosamine-1-phosphate N-acetyltransferase [Nocardioides sp.]